jgi:hypothetical protein
MDAFALWTRVSNRQHNTNCVPQPTLRAELQALPGSISIFFIRYFPALPVFEISRDHFCHEFHEGNWIQGHSAKEGLLSIGLGIRKIM